MSQIGAKNVESHNMDIYSEVLLVERFRNIMCNDLRFSVFRMVSNRMKYFTIVSGLA